MSAVNSNRYSIGVLTRRSERQTDVAQMVELMEKHDRTSILLTDDQVAKVEQRLADPSPRSLTLEEVRALCATTCVKILEA